MDNEKFKIPSIDPDTIERHSLENLIEDLKVKPVILYGAGLLGQAIFNKLREYGVYVEAFIDIKGNEGIFLERLHVYNPKDEYLLTIKDRKKLMICVGENARDYDLIIPLLNSKGITDIIPASIFTIHFWKISNMNNKYFNYKGHDIVRKNTSSIIECLNLFEDELSIETFNRFIRGFLSADIKEFIYPVKDIQYTMPKFIPLSQYSRFIDCGAFTGDTIKSLIDYGVKFDKIVAFEPNMDAFMQLKKVITENMGKINSAYIHPCGVWNTTEMLRFESNIGVSNCISDQGDTLIQCIALDEVLFGFEPTFIKMDIEGSEKEALIGCKDLINTFKPTLAISVYHEIEHLWEIPLLLKELNLGYKFYLRAFDKGYETILFAVVEN